MLLRRWIILGCAALAGTREAAAQPEEPSIFTPYAPVVFFPPTPPIYGAPVPTTLEGYAYFYRGRHMTAPDGVADFVGEHFYPALSTRLFSLELNRRLETRLHAYRTKRGELLNALLNAFVEAQDAAPAERARRLQAFAAEQTPQLATLEHEAEELRQALVAGGIWNRIDWNHERKWRLSSTASRHNWADVEAELQVMRAAAFYQDGLHVVQRGFLREIAMELRPVARKARGQPVAYDESDGIFFSPETARFRLPPNLAPALREKIGVYNGRKIQLKQELRAAIIAHDRDSAAKRAEALAALADRQWPQIVSLEELAEEIRHELATHVEPATPPPPPWLPAELLKNIHSYNEDRDSYFGEMKILVDHAGAQAGVPAVEEPVDERRARQIELAARQAAAREAVLAFQKEHAERFAGLHARYQTIREMLTIIARDQKDPKTGRPLDADSLLRRHVAAMKEFEVFGRESTIYTNYRIAMMQPGLSPEQRRLLFGSALAALAQPLPYGEIMPRNESKQPYVSR